LRANGTVESLSSINSKELRSLRNKVITARNCVISVFGDIKTDDVVKLVEEKLISMPAGETAARNLPATSKLVSSSVVEAQKDKAQAILMVGYHGADIYSSDRYALELIDEASSDLGSRFFVRIREQMGLAYFVGASQMQGLAGGVFLFYLGTDPVKLEPVKTALLEEINRLAATGLGEDELERAKKKLIGQQQIGNQSNDAFGHMAALDELYGLGYDHYKQLEKAVTAVTTADIKRVAKKYFLDQLPVIAIVRPPDGGASTNS
jgi:zinc protease